jgi:hypothetical protein
MGQRDVALEDEVRYRYTNVILHYRKSFIQEIAQRVSPLSFELEATLKLARFLCRYHCMLSISLNYHGVVSFLAVSCLSLRLLWYFCLVGSYIATKI